ncbi:hypothetical protein Sa4125_21080 [Aureimonas sp. SA4125]|uniref:hypothetical protein n=1 Tax=Aureimonas sp. SA4125 TaxID=2826993 RepID=UPI001CC38F3D|nr:hypothetical protein [Aureimonas sp. SA4125]BDA84566.1 hypothetical protein Sa4125_21080 [Aureimonas sp. SA4125]
MHFLPRIAFASALVLGSLPPAVADSYSATSNTAMSITGDIDMDDFSITFANGAMLNFSELVADHFVVDGRDVPASVFRVADPADPVLENGNSLCGNGDVTYIASWGAGADMTLGVFTGDAPPESDAEMCASYSYEIVG